MNGIDKTQVFLFSSTSEVPDRFFQGYCFVGADYIFGESGAAEYFKKTGREILAGEDGCYVTVRRRGRDYEFGADFSGNKKIFYYSDSGFWVVSNSLVRIIHHLKSNGRPVIPNFSQLSTVGGGKGSSFHNQMGTYFTAVGGVKLLPLKSSLIIGGRGAEIRSNIPLPAPLSYSHALAEFIETWLERFRTLLAVEPMRVNCDLTGGLDSRVVFSLLKRASEQLSDECRATIRINSGPSSSNSVDLDIASEICASCNMELNARRAPNPNKFSGPESYYSWKSLCLGVYHPIYFPGSAPYARIVSFGGGGGENHRPFYRDTSLSNFVRGRAARISPKWLGAQFRAELEDAFITIAQIEGAQLDPLIGHYRNFRNRMHAGRSPQYSVSFSPLGSKLLERASNVLPRASLLAGQVNYDVISAVQPGLLNVRFDKLSKEPTREIRDRITTVSVDDPEGKGWFYVGDEGLIGRSEVSSDSVWDCLREEYQGARSAPLSKEFWGDRFLSEADSALYGAIERRRFRHAVDGQPVAAVILTSLF